MNPLREARRHQEQEEPLVSVLVPVYNVERDLPQCLDSILDQSYQNLDIVLLDDGSTDGGGEICDSYATRDSRIRVTHVTNGGLSRARNLLLDLARGELLLFVDSDDWIEPETVCILVNALINADADMACCQRLMEWADHTEQLSWPFGARTLKGQEVLDGLFLDNVIGTFAWSKLYRAKLFQGIRYPEGHLYEDVATTYRICMNAHSVACIPDPLFHYRMRGSAITNSHSAANLIDYWIAQKQRYDMVSSTSDRYDHALLDHCVLAIGRTWRSWAACPKMERKAFSREISCMREFARMHTGEVMRGQFRRMRKLECLLGRIASPIVWKPLHLATLVHRRAVRRKRATYQ